MTKTPEENLIIPGAETPNQKNSRDVGGVKISNSVHGANDKGQTVFTRNEAAPIPSWENLEIDEDD